MKRAAFALAAALLLAACERAPEALAVAETPPAVRVASGEIPPLTGRVVDSAELLSPAEEARLVEELAALERRTSDQLVIVTVPSLGARTIEEYSRSLGNQWGIGQADKDNGVLLVVAPTDRKTRIQVGYGLEAILTNQRAAEIVGRDLVPNFREGRWSAGIDAGARAIIATLVAHEREPRLGR